MHTLYIHLLTLVDQRQQRGAQMLHHQSRIIPRQVLSSLDRYIMQHERAYNRIHHADAEVMKMMCAQILGYPQQPFDILAVGWISRIFGLRSVVVHASRQRV